MTDSAPVQRLPLDRTSGFSLVEMLVALALMSLIMIAGGMLITESVTLLGNTGRMLRSPDTTFAGARLRRDVQDAAMVLNHPLEPTSEPLELRLRDNSSVVIGWDGRDLLRWEFEAGSHSAEAQRLLPGVVGWQWHSLGTRAVEIWVTVLVFPGRHSRWRPRSDS